MATHTGPTRRTFLAPPLDARLSTPQENTERIPFFRLQEDEEETDG